jgi:hypothetical protein
MSFYAAMARLTSLIRWLDLRLWSNRFIAAATVLVSILRFAYGRYEGASNVDAGLDAARLGAGIFLAWAIARELDPDRPASATVATLIAAAFLLSGAPDLSALVALLASMRVALRSTGKPPTVLDPIFLAILAVLCSTRTTGVPAAASLAIALALDSHLPEPAGARRGVWGIVVALAAGAGAVHFGTLTASWKPPGGVELAGLVIVGVALLALRVPRPTSADDRRKPLSLRRLVAATALAVTTGAAAVLLVGGPAFPALSPLWAAVAGVVLHRRVRSAKAGREAKM